MEKVITLKSISLRNFKGIKDQRFDFSTRESSIVGDNGTGKSSLFAAFVWCLFGKDQFGRTNYQLKTLVDGKTDRNKECEVEIVIDINGEVKTLRRVYYEKWSRPSATAVDVFKANSTNYYINDINVKESEYIAEIKDICAEDVFRTITNPSYFPNLKEDQQRAFLFRMLGEVDNETIAEGSPDLLEFLQMVTGESFESFKKEVANKKSRLEKEKKDIPARVDELKHTIPEPADWEAIEKELSGKEAELKKIDEQLADASKFSEEQNNKRLEIRNRINELERANQSIVFFGRAQKDADTEKMQADIRKLHLQRGDKRRDYETKKSRLEYLNKEKERLDAEMKSLIDEWKIISNEKLVFAFDDKEFVCPTCGTPFNDAIVEEKQKEMTEKFNKDKSERISRNVKKGELCRNELGKVNQELAAIGELQQTDTSDIDTQIKEKDMEVAAFKEKEFVLEEYLNAEQKEVYTNNLNKIAEYKKSLDTPQEVQDTTIQQEQKERIQQAIEALSADLANKTIIENTQQRIKELNDLEAKLKQEIAGLERQEFLQKSFEQAKNRYYEKAINQLFSLVKFNLFKQQVDGQIVPTCEAHVDGVPYSTQNNAMQIAMGLDIIDSISKYEGIYAPIWLDNRESTTTIPKMKTQIINLVVDPEEKELRKIDGEYKPKYSVLSAAGNLMFENSSR